MSREGEGLDLQRIRFHLRAKGMKEEGSSSLKTGIHHRGYLPHIKKEGVSYFITFRLADSLPQEVLLQFRKERDAQLMALQQGQRSESSQITDNPSDEILTNVQSEYRRKIELHLDQGAGECHLRRPAIAKIVQDAFQHFHAHNYTLDEWVIMPNHVHLILWPMPGFTLSQILKSRKQYTATMANQILGTRGKPFWQPESFDRWIRDSDERMRVRRYIQANPVKAGLCQRAEDWKWGSAAVKGRVIDLL